jgi:hypothetical protein
MSSLEDRLRDALRREDPGPEFTARLLARAAAAPALMPDWWRRLAAPFRPAKIRWAAAGVLACLLVVAGAVEYRQRQARIEGEAAKRQLVLALRVAGTKLHLARAKVVELNGGL